MPIQPSIDDTNTTVITYQGTWELLVGSSRQWNSTAHSTLTPGSSATFSFRGYQVWVWGTIPAGVGSNLVDFSIDGSTPNVTSRTSNGSEVYNEQYYASPLLRETYHTIVVTNRGSNANDNTEFMLDRFEFVSSDTVPIFTPSGVSVTPTSTSTPSSPATGSSGAVTSSGGSKTPLSAIAGAVIGVLALIIVVLSYLLWRKRKSRVESSSKNEKPSTSAFLDRSALVPTPFPLNDSASTPYHPSADPLSVPSETNSPTNPQPRRSNAANPIMSEKLSYRTFRSESIPSNSTNNAYTDTGSSERESLPMTLPSSTNSLRMTSSNTQFPPIAGATSLMNDDASSMYVPHTSLRTFVERFAAVPSPTSDVPSDSASDAFEHPPPSYSRDNQDPSTVSGPNTP